MPAKMSPRCNLPHRSPPVLTCGVEADLRCGCGSLLAKLVSGAVELKCRRCKRTWSIPLGRS